MPDRRKWPTYSRAEQEVIGEYLSVYGGYCLDALRRAEALLAIDKEDPYAQSMVTRWTYGLQVCNWMLRLLPSKQKHLAIKAYFKAHGVLPP